MFDCGVRANGNVNKRAPGPGDGNEPANIGITSHTIVDGRREHGRARVVKRPGPHFEHRRRLEGRTVRQDQHPHVAWGLWSVSLTREVIEPESKRGLIQLLQRCHPGGDVVQHCGHRRQADAVLERKL